MRAEPGHDGGSKLAPGAEIPLRPASPPPLPPISDGQRVVSLGTTPASAISGYRPPDRVTVEVSRELLKQLSEWSRPVQVRIDHTDNGYEITTRTHDCRQAS